jgi:hypothetical protein
MARCLKCTIMASVTVLQLLSKHMYLQRVYFTVELPQSVSLIVSSAPVAVSSVFQPILQCR